LPIQPRREREAISWLAKHIEGEVGYNLEANPLKDLLVAIEAVHAQQVELGVEGPDYVTVTSPIGTANAAAPGDPLTPEKVYPLIQEFEVTVPTDGFVYDELRLIG
jgi:hypothetical protein